MWWHKKNYQKSVSVLPPDGHSQIRQLMSIALMLYLNEEPCKIMDESNKND